MRRGGSSATPGGGAALLNGAEKIREGGAGGAPAVYQYPLYEADQRRLCTVLLVGAPKTGKTALANALTNVAAGVAPSSGFRYVLSEASTRELREDVVELADRFSGEGGLALQLIDTPGVKDEAAARRLAGTLRSSFEDGRALSAVLFMTKRDRGGGGAGLLPHEQLLYALVSEMFGDDADAYIHRVETFAGDAAAPGDGTRTATPTVVDNAAVFAGNREEAFAPYVALLEKLVGAAGSQPRARTLQPPIIPGARRIGFACPLFIYQYPRPQVSAEQAMAMKTVLLVGAKGAGKTALANAMLNGCLGVRGAAHTRRYILDDTMDATSRRRRTESFLINTSLVDIQTQKPIVMKIIIAPPLRDASTADEIVAYMSRSSMNSLTAIVHVERADQGTAGAPVPEQHERFFERLLQSFGGGTLVQVVTFVDGKESGSQPQPPSFAYHTKDIAPYAADGSKMLDLVHYILSQPDMVMQTPIEPYATRLPAKDGSAPIVRYLYKYEPTPEERLSAKTILFVGKTGAGKTTLLNALVNHILGVQFTDRHRYVIVNEPLVGGTQAESQTPDITDYYIPARNGYPMLRVIDTPGLCGTKHRDPEIVAKLTARFTGKDEKGGVVPEDKVIDTVSAICFVVDATFNRYTDEARYMFEEIFKLFAKDVAGNFIAMLTKAPSGQCDALDTLQDPRCPFHQVAVNCKDSKEDNKWYYTFNNSAIFPRNENDLNDQRVFIDFASAMKEYEKFLKRAVEMPVGSLKQSKLLLLQRRDDEKKKLESIRKSLYQTSDDIMGLRRHLLSILRIEHTLQELAQAKGAACMQRAQPNLKEEITEKYGKKEPTKTKNRVCNACKQTCTKNVTNWSTVARSAVTAIGGLFGHFVSRLGAAPGAANRASAVADPGAATRALAVASPCAVAGSVAGALAIAAIASYMDSCSCGHSKEDHEYGYFAYVTRKRTVYKENKQAKELLERIMNGEKNVKTELEAAGKSRSTLRQALASCLADLAEMRQVVEEVAEVGLMPMAEVPKSAHAIVNGLLTREAKQLEKEHLDSLGVIGGIAEQMTREDESWDLHGRESALEKAAAFLTDAVIDGLARE